MKRPSPNNKELVRIALTEGGRMRQIEIREWLPANNYRELNPNNVGSAVHALVEEAQIEKDGVYYSIVAGSELRARQSPVVQNRDGPSERLLVGKSTSPSLSTSALIPCYGMNWHRDQVEWGQNPSLIGSPGRGGDRMRVNFAEQAGVYVLYEWPNVTYVGRTTNQHLYERLHSHTTNKRREWWDRFSWFGLLAVGPKQTLVRRREGLDMAQAIEAMETILIEVLSPPLNDKAGDHLGIRYAQVPMVEERQRREWVNQLGTVLAQK